MVRSRSVAWGMVALALLAPACTLFLAGDPTLALCDNDADCDDATACKSGFCRPLDDAELPFTVDAGSDDDGEGEAEDPVEGEGEDPAEGEGEDPAEGEGEDPTEGEGEDPAEGEGEPPPSPPRTCREQLLRTPSSPSGTYRLDLNGDGASDRDFFCEMVRDGGGWTRVALLDHRDPAFACPAALRATSLPDGSTGCARPSGGASQPAVRFTVPHDFAEVGGRVTGVVFGDQDAFVNHPQDLARIYVDGVSLTTGPEAAREHVFTFIGAHPFDAERVNRCPCEAGAVQPPSFVGNAFFCDKPTAAGARPGNGRAWDVGNPVWDGPDVCSPGDVDGYFVRALGRSHVAADGLELRVMSDQNTDLVSGADENVALTFIELYVR